MVFFLNNFVDPAKRQNFGNASAEICIPVLRVRPNINNVDNVAMLTMLRQSETIIVMDSEVIHFEFLHQQDEMQPHLKICCNNPCWLFC